MIISHRHQFVFIKTRKTAGSSLEIGLSRVCGPQDIVTPLSEHRGEESFRRQEGGIGPINYLKPVSRHRGFKEWRRLLTRGQRASYGQHTRAHEIRDLLGEDKWNRYYRFTVERNPWDRALSRYWWQKHRWESKGRTEFPSLSEYLAWMEMHKPHWLSNWGHYTINDELAVHKVLRYETLSADLEALQSELDMDGDISLPTYRAKGGFRKDSRHYSEVLGPEDRAIIERVCHHEISVLGYRFEDA
ncbi:sulfotransferase family 2 domain-containing protein [Thioalkalivibrio thiocyanoxidans]|uniref:sulfotransferase family 2 domain-containing protein n=1 Tax=Thioalkalivibrio thiocyanoxidans TaxID=152475 RepID=UPI0003A997BD|nr:sulfotransferase family 2 domain-containing protein [Thioalkalivibrio thiocyanoxidans]